MKLPLFFSLLWYCILPAQIIVQSGLTHRLETPPGVAETVPISLKNVGNVAMDCHLEISDVRPLAIAAISTFLQDLPTRVVPIGSSLNGSNSYFNPARSSLSKFD